MSKKSSTFAPDLSKMKNIYHIPTIEIISLKGENPFMTTAESKWYWHAPARDGDRKPVF